MLELSKMNLKTNIISMLQQEITSLTQIKIESLSNKIKHLEKK